MQVNTNGLVQSIITSKIKSNTVEIFCRIKGTEYMIRKRNTKIQCLYADHNIRNQIQTASIGIVLKSNGGIAVACGPLHQLTKKVTFGTQCALSPFDFKLQGDE